ncbi:HlyD family secretion protein [Pseudaestuariivita rosea]|uniref:HlyD family secretion protein n=1 Tax=Pseudaestuariivita rosea TaxID=2763263 RepID=UPI001ABB56C9|nr:HlyD family efflux transporter periplasmic adaptor subunit [Pseudaestuariivita rosea]
MGQTPEGPWLAVATGRVDIEGGVMRLAAQREGVIAEVFVTEGDRVEKGQPLARINDTTAQLQLQIAREQLLQSEIQAELAQLRASQALAESVRLSSLVAADAIPSRQADEARRASQQTDLEVRSAKIAVTLAERGVAQQEAEVEAHVIRAPRPGTILRSSARVGDGTSTTNVTEMFLLAPDAPRVVRANLDEQFVGLVEAGQKTEIISEQAVGETFAGEVHRVAGVYGTPGQPGNDARTVEIVVRIDAKPEVANDLILGQRMVVRVLR